MGLERGLDSLPGEFACGGYGGGLDGRENLCVGRVGGGLLEPAGQQQGLLDQEGFEWRLRLERAAEHRRSSRWNRKLPPTDRYRQNQLLHPWLFYRRVKTGKSFYRPMNRVVHAHLKSIRPDDPPPDDPVFLGGGARPNARFQALCALAGIQPRANAGTGNDEPWELKDLRKTCATYYDAHVPESSVEILGHSVGGITYRHYAHRAPLAFKAIMTLPQPTAFAALARGFDGECPCCRRQFAEAS